MDNIYIRWYYGYKNFWDELLLLWLLSYVSSLYPSATIYIQSDNVWRLTTWIKKNNQYIDYIKNLIFVVDSLPIFPRKWDYLILWWWEVVTDARPFPYNWRSYLKHFFWIFCRSFALYWWIWTIKKFWTRQLYSFLLSRADSIVVRETYSYDIASKYSSSVVLHQDFAYDALNNIWSINKLSQNSWYVIININKHVRNDELKLSLGATLSNHLDKELYFFPASVWSDDADIDLLDELLPLFPNIKLYDRTKHTLKETLNFIQWANFAVAARLHVVLLLKHMDTPFSPIFYQEKVNRILQHL